MINNMNKIRLFDRKLNKTDYLVTKDDELYNQYYHLTTELWIINENNQVLLLKNGYDYSKRYPGLYTCLGCNLINDETIEDAVKRLKNKISLKITDENLIKLKPVVIKEHKYAYVTCILKANIDKESIKLNNDYTNYVFADKEELIKMCNNGEIAYYLVARIKDIIVDYLK